jgi:molybdopterin/thiamine biosynthesis adenylyltransferase
VRAIVVGAGGLGGPIAIALAAAHVDVTVVDDDVIELSNLHRQIQFGTSDLGKPKAAVLADRIGGRGVRARFTAETADQLAHGADVLVDGSDDPATKFLVADHARAHARPYIIAAALRYGGNVFAGAPGSACYRCLFEDPPDDAPTCGDSGVLGPLVGWVGGVAADRALRLLRDPRRDPPIAGTLWVLDDFRTSSPREITLSRRASCICA